MRKLVHVPMLHSKEALSSQANKVGDIAAKISSERMAPFSDRYWNIIEQRLQSLNPAKPVFYLEGYNGKPHTVSINNNNSYFPSTNPVPEFRIVADFINRIGGRAETTEDGVLMENNFKIIYKLGEILKLAEDRVNSGQDAMTEEMIQEWLIYRELKEDVMLLRDYTIAYNITQTLKDGETGILFLGAGHDVLTKLPPDIAIELLDGRLDEMHAEVMTEIRRNNVSGSREKRG